MASPVVKSLTAEHRAYLLALPGWKTAHGADHLCWPEEEVSRNLCKHLDIALLDPFDEIWADEQLYRQWGEECHRLRILPLWRNGLLWSVAMEEPWNLGLYPEIMGLFRCQLVTCGILTQDLDRVLSTFRARWDAEPKAAPKPSGDFGRPRGFWPIEASQRDRFDSLVKTILIEGVEMGASDILFEPKDDCMQIRVCINENFQNLPPLDVVYRDECIVALKNFASIDTTVMDGFQSTSANLRIPSGALVNFRIECQSVQLTSGKSQAFAFRPQDSAKVARGKMSLPFEEPILGQVLHCLAQKQGVIYTTGPTGSGKTTTLHACLGQLDPVRLNVRTIEDPVEYLIRAYGQTPVGRAASKEGNLTFAGGLHSNLRFHPHVILVGEIRDSVVAQVACEAALTGHLILTTLHTSDALGAISRLLTIGGDGVDASVLAETTKIILAQRMIRLLCGNCRRPQEVTPLIREHFEFYQMEPPATVFEPCGCAHCRKSGYAGKRPIFEAVFFDEGMKRIVNRNFDRQVAMDYWLRQQKATPLGKAALRLVKEGIASYNDVSGYDGLFHPKGIIENP